MLKCCSSENPGEQNGQGEGEYVELQLKIDVFV